MDRKTKGRVAEAKVVAFFIENGYDVFVPFSDCTTMDLVAIRDGNVYRVSVKYTAQRENQKWKVRLSNNSRQRDGSSVERTFNHSAYDLLAVYIGPEDRVAIREVNFDAKYALAIA